MGPFTLTELLGFLGERGIVVLGAAQDDGRAITGFSPITATREGTLSWMRCQELHWAEIKAAAVICQNGAATPSDSRVAYIPVPNPRLAFAKVLTKFGVEPLEPGVHPTAVIGKNVTMGKGCFIGPYTTIGDNVAIGDKTVIHAGAHIYGNVRIGRDCIIHGGAVIGSESLAFELDADGSWAHFPQMGCVTIGDGVEIGANACVDRGTLVDTVIEDGVKIGALCHVSHNCIIGVDSLLISSVCLCGGVRVGRHAWLGPGCVVQEKVSVGEGAFVGGGAMVTTDVGEGDMALARAAENKAQLAKRKAKEMSVARLLGDAK